MYFVSCYRAFRTPPGGLPDALLEDAGNGTDFELVEKMVQCTVLGEPRFCQKCKGYKVRILNNPSPTVPITASGAESAC